MFSIGTHRLAGAALAAALLAGCAGGMGAAVPSGPGRTMDLDAVRAMMPYAATPAIVPPACKGQKKTKQYASDTEKMTAAGGTLCIPAFGGFGGSITYPPANPAVKVTLTSSTTNYDNLPNPGTGTAIFYLQLALLGNTRFGPSAPAGGGLASAAIKPKRAYTLYGAVALGSLWISFPPCFAIAKKGKYGGQISGLGSLLAGQSLEQTTGVVIVYPGKQSTTKCG